MAVARGLGPGLGPESIESTSEGRTGSRYASLGHANKVIAYELGIAASSVATHLSQAADKLDVSSRAELISKTCWIKELRAQVARSAPLPVAQQGALERNERPMEPGDDQARPGDQVRAMLR